MHKKVYKCDFIESFKKPRFKMFYEPIPIFYLKIDSDDIKMVCDMKTISIEFKRIKNIILWISTTTELSRYGTRKKINYDLHVITDYENYILEFKVLKRLINFLEVLEKKGVVIEDKMKLRSILKNTDDIEGIIAIEENILTNIEIFEEKYGNIEKNRPKYKYVGRF